MARRCPSLSEPQHHRDKAASNELASTVAGEAGHRDWTTIMLFYAALHLANSVLADVPGNKRPRIGNHQLQKTLISKHPDLRSIYKDYVKLESRSWAARYRCSSVGAENLENTVDRFARIKQAVNDYHNGAA